MNRAHRIRPVWLLAPAAAALLAVLFVPSGSARLAGAHGANPTLFACVGTSTNGNAYSIELSNSQSGQDCGTPISTLPEGTYDIQVDDWATVHNFHLVGPNGDVIKTSISGTQHTTVTVTLSAGSYSYRCDAHPFSMKGSFTVTAVVPPPQLTVAKAGSGSGSVTSDPAGINCGSTCTHAFDPGTQVTLTATPSSGSTFTGWSGDCSGTAACTLTMSEDHSATATFERDKTLTVTKTGNGTGSVSSAPAGIACGQTCVHAYPHGTQVTLTASAAPGSTFAGWSGTCSGAGLCTLAMDQDRTATATFVLAPQTLSVAKAGSGSGTITSNPPGIDCGQTCTRIFARGTQVTLTATAAAGSAFAGWSGACSGTGACTLTMDQNRSATATFVLVPHTLSVIPAGSGAGTVSSSPPGIDCGSACSYEFDHGTQVTLSAVAAARSVFAGWSGACSGTGTCSVTLNGDTSVSATFLKRCIVPRVIDKRRVAAVRLIKRASCSVGKVRRVFSSRKKGRVVAQRPAPHTILRPAGKVRLKVSKGPKRRG